MTALRDIVVVLDDSASSAMRLTVAVDLAQQHGAHRTGFSAMDLLLPARPAVQRRDNPQEDTLPASPLMNWGAVLTHDYPEADTQAAEAAERIETAFRERLEFSNLQGRFERFGTNILVGWNNSREAARAINDAIPLLAKAVSVTILEANPIGRKPAIDDAASADITRHLSRHGISAKTARTALAGMTASDALLSYAADVSTDLLVIGGYGHSRLRERILGGVPRELLQHMTLPVLMSH